MTDWDLRSLEGVRAAWSEGVQPVEMVGEVVRRIAARDDLHAWIHRVSADDMRERAASLGSWTPARGPLWGVPFAVKDNIDVAGLPTTAGCPAFAYEASVSAPVVERLLDAGAVLVGKTNMDQFATGLSGARSPYGVVHSVIDERLIGGGSSSGSAVAVAAGLVTFALGTDTAGSGRVPAACNGIVGAKPSVGMLSTRGVVPACPSLDCVSVFAYEVEDAWAVVAATAGFDRHDPFSRAVAPVVPTAEPVRLGVPNASVEVPAVFHDRASRFAAASGARVVAVDVSPHLAAGELLYRGGWLAERYGSIGRFIDDHPMAVDPTVAAVVGPGRAITGADVFADQHRLRALRREADAVWADCDALLLPTVDRVLTVDEILAAPIEANAQLGRFTTFVNLLQMAAVAFPAGTDAEERPFGLSLVAAADADRWLHDLATSGLAPYAERVQRIRLAAAQLNMVVGDLDGNVERILAAMKAAEADDADLVAFPELAITGYPPEDLLLKPGFVTDNREALDTVVARSGRSVAFVGFVDRDARGLYNAAAVCANGELLGVYRKRRLPNSDVFDEHRYFVPGDEALRLYEIAGVSVGISICEDAWSASGPILEQAQGGAQLIVNINGSPYHAGKLGVREQILAARATESECTILYVNLVGGQDELVFDGASLVISPNGTIVTRAGQYTEELFVTDVELDATGRDRTLPMADVTSAPIATGPLKANVPVEPLPPAAEIYGALVLGTRDYVRKNGFTDVVLGLSGGIDSSLVAAISVDALGAEHVHGVLMPSRYSSDHSITDAEQLAQNLGVEHRTIVIEPAFTALLDMLGPSFGDRPADITEENLQPRVRGLVLMALSNKFGWLVLTTGNKSEMAVGYTTLYGDMAGGFGVIKDVWKTMVYDVCEYRNQAAGRELIPATVLTKPPSAELRPDQVDTDSLPPYSVLDRILDAYIEDDRTAGDLIDAGEDPELVRRIVRLIDLSEYKRRQAPPGVRVTTKAFGKDRRLPITNLYGG